MRRLALIVALIVALVAALSGLGGVAFAKPKGQHGARIQAVAGGVPTPTSFAFAGHTVFAGAFGRQDGTGGGIYVVRHGLATLVPGTGPVAFGLAWHDGVLYASAGGQVVAYGGWNGSAFAQRQVLYTGVAAFPGFGGLAWGPDGRFYAGVLNPQGAADHADTGAPYLFDVVSLNPDGTGIEVVATGIRQPFQLAFAAGFSGPFVSDLGQDSGARRPPDAIVLAGAGTHFGFPYCNWLSARGCAGATEPFKLLPAHTDPMGIAAIGRTLYVAEFGGPGGAGRHPQVVSLSTRTRRVEPVATGYAAPVIALGASGGALYTGDESGTVYRIKP